MGRTSDAREKLLQTAATLFHQQSYNGTGVGDICKHAGVKRGSFYHFFDSKQDIAIAGLESIACDMRPALESIANREDLDAREKMQLVCDTFSATYTRIGHDGKEVYGCPMGNIASELSTQNDVLREYVEQQFAFLTEVLTSILAEAKSTGLLDSDLSAEVIATDAIAYMQGLILLAKTRRNPELFHRIGPGILKTCGFNL